MFDCNRTKAEGTKWICQFSRQHQMHTPTWVLNLFQHSDDHSLWQYSTWYSKRRVCVRESDILEHLIVIEPNQKVQNEYVSSRDSINFARQLSGFHRSNDHNLSDYSTWYSKRRVYRSKSDLLGAFDCRRKISLDRRGVSKQSQPQHNVN
jgi:hypothetical protein